MPFRSLGAAKILVGLHTPDRSTVDRRKLRCLLGRALPRAVRNTGHLRWQCSGTMGGRRQDGTASKRPARAAQPTSTRHFPKCGCGNSGPPRSVQFARQCCRTVLRPGSMNMETIDLAAVGPHGASGARQSTGTFRRSGDHCMVGPLAQPRWNCRNHLGNLSDGRSGTVVRGAVVRPGRSVCHSYLVRQGAACRG